jgi:hypothetical protein
MSLKDSLSVEHEMRPECDLGGGVRGKYFNEYQAGTNVVVLDPDVATVFRNSEKVNRVLRLLIDVANREVKSVRRKGRASNKGLQRPGRKVSRG